MSEKYYKYKQKYLQLKNILQTGGLYDTNQPININQVKNKGFYQVYLTKLIGTTPDLVLLTKIEGKEPRYLYKSDLCNEYLYESNEDIKNTKSKKIMLKIWVPNMTDELPDSYNNCEIKKSKNQLNCADRIILELNKENSSSLLNAGEKISMQRVDIDYSKSISPDIKLQIAKKLGEIEINIYNSKFDDDIKEKSKKFIINSNSIEENLEISKKLKQEFNNELKKLTNKADEIYSTVKHFIENDKNISDSEYKN